MLSRNHALIWRTAYARVPFFTPTNTAECALYNNSSGPHVLVVWDVVVYVGTAFNFANGYLLYNGKLSTKTDDGHSIIAGESTQVGQAYKDDVASPLAITADNVFNTIPDSNTMPNPYAVLLPGWSMVVTASTSATPFGATFYYQVLYADEFAATRGEYPLK